MGSYEVAIREPQTLEGDDTWCTAGITTFFSRTGLTGGPVQRSEAKEDADDGRTLQKGALQDIQDI